MNYLKIYNLLIFKRLYLDVLHKTSNQPGKYEFHHVIPKACGGTDDKKNLVCLTVREHLFAHRILIKIYEHTDYEKSLKWAYHYMCKTRSGLKLTSKQIAKIREFSVGENNPTKRLDVRMKISKTNMGHFVSKEAREKMRIRRLGKSPANKGKPISEKQRLDFVGRICINNGKCNRYIHKTDPIPNGWQIGLVRKNYRKNKICITNGIQVKYIFNNEIIPVGWHVGGIAKHKNFKWITNGKNNKQIYDNNIPDGWYAGFTCLK